MKKFFALTLLAFFSSCIGTDFTDDPLILNEASLNLINENITIALGQTTTLEVEAKDVDGTPYSGSLSWESSDEKVIKVSDGGGVEAINLGTANVMVSFADRLEKKHSSSVGVEVVDDANSIGSIVINVPKKIIATDEELQFTAVVKSAGGQSLENPVTWSSSKPEVANINPSGKITGQTEGLTEVSAYIDNFESNRIEIVVSNPNENNKASFEGKTGHSVSGDMELNKSSRKVSLSSNFKTQAGPGLHVYLGKKSDSGSGGIDLGKVKSNSGSQDYDIPDNVNINDFNYVLIYCKPFGVVFGAAKFN